MRRIQIELIVRSLAENARGKTVGRMPGSAADGGSREAYCLALPWGLFQRPIAAIQGVSG